MPCAPSDLFVIKDASLFMTADKIALFAAFYCSAQKRRGKKKQEHIGESILSGKTKNFFLKTSQWQDVSRSAMIVLAASVKKRFHFKKKKKKRLLQLFKW